MPNQEREIDQVTQSVVVDCPREDAFELFTSRIGEWWPRAQDAGETEIREIEPCEGGRVFERTPSGEEAEWGRVTDWDPPHRVSFAREEEAVEVTFLTVADGTQVTVTHRMSGYAVAMCFARFVCEAMVAV
jgi:hypothetical protein